MCSSDQMLRPAKMWQKPRALLHVQCYLCWFGVHTLENKVPNIMGRKELAEHWETLNHMLKKSNSVLERMYSGKNWTGRDFCSIFQSQATAYLNEDWPHEGLTLGTWVKVWQNNSQAKTFLEVFTTFQTCEVGLKLWPLRKPWLQSKQVKHLTANRKVMEGLELRGALWPFAKWSMASQHFKSYHIFAD